MKSGRFPDDLPHAPGNGTRAAAGRAPSPMVGAAEFESSDEALLERVRARAADGLEALYDRYHGVALAVALRLLKDQQLAEDVVQDAFLALWRRAATYQGERGAVRAWLLSIVHHRCVDHLRRRRVAQPVAQPVALEETLEDTDRLEVWEEAAGNIRQARVREALLALLALPDEQRHTVHLAYFGGLSCQQIADRTNVPLGTVKGRIRLALQKLRQALRSERPGEGT